MGGALSLGPAFAAGALLLALAGEGAAKERLFLTDGYRYEPVGGAVDEATAEVALALCGARCNALSADYQSYVMTMGWRLTKVGEGVERVVDLANPFLGGRCICTGDEYLAELTYYRPGGPPAPGASGPEGVRAGAAGESGGGATR